MLSSVSGCLWTYPERGISQCCTTRKDAQVLGKSYEDLEIPTRCHLESGQNQCFGIWKAQNVVMVEGCRTTQRRHSEIMASKRHVEDYVEDYFQDSADSLNARDTNRVAGQVNERCCCCCCVLVSSDGGTRKPEGLVATSSDG